MNIANIMGVRGKPPPFLCLIDSVHTYVFIYIHILVPPPAFLTYLILYAERVFVDAHCIQHQNVDEKNENNDVSSVESTSTQNDFESTTNSISTIASTTRSKR
jgi:hypothetical protein